MGTLPAQGTFTGSLPAKPSTGDGSDGSVVLSSSMSIPGGTYQYTSYESAAMIMMPMPNSPVRE